MSDLIDAGITTPTVGQTLVYNGTKWVNQTSTSHLIAIYTGTTAATSGTSTIPADNTTPQSNEGSQIWSKTITPASSASYFEIAQTFMLDSSSSNKNITVAVFRGATCIYATGINVGYSGRPQSLSVFTIDTPNTSSNVTYSMRIGNSSSSTWYVNQAYGNIDYGGTVNKSDWTIKEFV
jgi:hypothetical protein